jgi:glutathione S-transferase
MALRPRKDDMFRHRHASRGTTGLPKGAPMSIVLYHHPFSRAATVIWMLEELGVPYELRFVDILKGAQKAPELVAKNPMGKLPIARRRRRGRHRGRRHRPLPRRSLRARESSRPRSTIRRARHVLPLVALRAVGRRARARWPRPRAGSSSPARPAGASYDAMLSAMEQRGLAGRVPLGERIHHGRRHLRRHAALHAPLQDDRGPPAFTAYAERLEKREALTRADARNAAIIAERGLGG